MDISHGQKDSPSRTKNRKEWDARGSGVSPEWDMENGKKG